MTGYTTRASILFLLLQFAVLPVSAAGDPSVSREQIGRMIMVGFRGSRVSSQHPIVEQIRNGYVGGVVLYDRDVPDSRPIRNITSPGQVRRLNRHLQSIREERLLVAVDQEGGSIQRLTPDRGFDGMVSAAHLGQRSDTQETYRQALGTARQLARLGFNVNFAPVVDLNRNPGNPVIGGLGRSFGSDPRTVVKHASAVIRAHRRQGVVPVIKHFPGHGSSRGDTHRGFVDVRGLWNPRELIPFRRLIQDHGVRCVMTAHLFNPRWDPNWPATLSSRVIGRMLRKEMNFDGVVISDDLQMKALRKHYDRSTVLRRSIEAGVDVLLLANNSVYEPRVAKRTVQAIRRMIENHRIDPARILESNRRLRQLKHSLQSLPR